MTYKSIVPAQPAPPGGTGTIATGSPHLPSPQRPGALVRKAAPAPGQWMIALGTLAALTLIAIPLGVGYLGLLYPHILTPLVDGGFKQLSKANQQYQEGDLPQAIQMAMAIQPDSPAYADAQAAIGQWQTEWQILQQRLTQIHTAEAEADWETALTLAEQLPTNPFWQTQRLDLIQHAQMRLDQGGRLQLQAAFEAAYHQDFVKALAHLRGISPRCAAYALVPEKMAQYTQYRNIRSQYYLQLAYNQAEAQDFDLALGYLQHIDTDSPTYDLAQQKIAEYTEKRNQRAQYFILRATNRATLQDYGGAILLLQRVSPHSPGYADAQNQILAYGEQLRTLPPKPERATPPLPQSPPKQSRPLPTTAAPLTVTESLPPGRSPLNPGDRLTEVSPPSWPMKP